MSGAMSQAVADAARTLALEAEARATGRSVREVAIAQARARALANSKAKDPTGAGLPARTWAGMDQRTRIVLVMLGTANDGDPRRLAMQPWGSFSDAERDSMGAVARTLRRELQSASCLF